MTHSAVQPVSRRLTASSLSGSSVFGKGKEGAVKRVKDDSDSDEEVRGKVARALAEKPTDLLAPPKVRLGAGVRRRVIGSRRVE